MAAVHYPGLTSHPQHELAQRTLRAGMAGGMLSIDLAGGREAGERFLDGLNGRPRHQPGQRGDLCSHPASSSHRQLTEEELAQAGLTPGMVRISIGLEDPTTSIADLAAAAADSR